MYRAFGETQGDELKSVYSSFRLLLQNVICKVLEEDVRQKASMQQRRISQKYTRCFQGKVYRKNRIRCNETSCYGIREPQKKRKLE